MNYRDFFKNKKATAKDIQDLIPEGVDPREFNKGIGTEKEHTDDEFVAAKIAGDHLREDPKYYTKLNAAGLEEDNMEERHGACEDELGGETSIDFNGGLPKIGGVLDAPHNGRPIMLGKIISVGGLGKGPASGELSGMTAAGKSGGTAPDKGGIKADSPGDKEPLTAGGKSTAGSSIATKSVGGPVTPGEGQKQGGPNSQGTIAATVRLDETKQKVREVVKQVLKEIRYNKTTGKWERINENTVDMKMGPSYKKVQPVMYQDSEDDWARNNQFDPEITEMYDDEEECAMNERYVELANAQRNLSETEIAEMKSLREKIDNIAITKRNFGLSQGGTSPNVFEGEIEEKKGKKNWIKGAINHPDRCTPMSKPGCTGHARALAKRFKSGDLSEAEECKLDAAMKMGPFYRVVAPMQARVLGCDQAHRNQDCPHSTNEEIGPAYNPEENPLSINTGRTTDRSRKGVELGHPGQTGGFHTWRCNRCNYEITTRGGNRPMDIKWKDGHICNFEPAPAHDVDKVDEYGGFARQECSYRTVQDNPQRGKNRNDPRLASDVTEASKPSKVSKTIKKGMKTKTSTFKQILKQKKPAKTHSGVHKKKF